MNDFHRRRIASTFREIDGRLAQIEAILQAVGSQSPFSAYALDLEPMARQGLAARRNHAPAWQASGMARIERRIGEFLRTEKRDVRQRAG